jgi:hypothetical protein
MAESRAEEWRGRMPETVPSHRSVSVHSSTVQCGVLHHSKVQYNTVQNSTVLNGTSSAHVSLCAV